MREGMGKGVDVFLLTHPSRGVTLIRDGLEAGLDVFLLTHPSRGVTGMNKKEIVLQAISTHTFLAGCDKYGWGRVLDWIDFYSHTPRGV